MRPKTANTLIEHSNKLEQTVNVLENQTIPQFTAYVDKQKQSIDAAALNAQNAATAAQASAASAESARQNTEKIQQQVVIESKSVSEKYNQVIEMTGRVEEATPSGGCSQNSDQCGGNGKYSSQTG